MGHPRAVSFLRMEPVHKAAVLRPHPHHPREPLPEVLYANHGVPLKHGVPHLELIREACGKVFADCPIRDETQANETPVRIHPEGGRHERAREAAVVIEVHASEDVGLALAVGGGMKLARTRDPVGAAVHGVQ